MGLPIRVFIASSSEHLEVARTIRDLLSGDAHIAPRVWDEGTFKLSRTYIESLERELDAADFAVLALTPDDVGISRNNKKKMPRDNLLFELGLFMGRLGRERCYLVHPKSEDLKLPSDLLGVKPAGYEKKKGRSLRAALQRAGDAIQDSVLEQGARIKPSPESIEERRRVRQFCDRVKGAWWQRKVVEGVASLSFSRFVPHEATHTLRISGDSYDATGKSRAHFESTAVGIRAEGNSVLYSWQGSHPVSHPGEPFEGFGEMTFEDSTGPFTRGRGHFADIQLTRRKNVVWKSTELRRVTRKSDIRTMTQGGAKARAALLGRTLAGW